MPDITEQILAETTPNPLYHPLFPTTGGTLTDYRDNISSEIGELMGYEQDLNYYENQITIEWATAEMKEHQMSWVRVGLVADRVRRYRLYRPQFPNWKAYCQEVLGKRNWQVNKIINCALAVMNLIDEGFDLIPNCVSQVDRLIACCKKSGQLLVDAWETVTEQLPAAHLLTANRISEALGFSINDGNQIPKRYRDRLRAVADRDGMTIEEKMEELLWLDEDTKMPDEEEELNETEEELEVREQTWREDMNQLVREHDSQIWLLGAVTRLLRQVNKPSGFSWLRQLRYQT